MLTQRRMCSTPNGIKSRITYLDEGIARRIFARCSTPNGIKSRITFKAERARFVLGLLVLNA